MGNRNGWFRHHKLKGRSFCNSKNRWIGNNAQGWKVSNHYYQGELWQSKQATWNQIQQ